MTSTARLLVALVCVLLMAACDDEGATTIVPGGPDCFLIYSDLRPDWVVDFAENITTAVFDCDAIPMFAGTPISVTTAAVLYPNVLVNASDQSTSFQVLGDLGPFAPAGSELIAAVEADTCLALIQIWENDDNAYLHCIGTLDRSARAILASCDSASFDPNRDGAIDVTCALPTIDVAVTIGP